jgi:hypothetical protein
VTVLLTLVAIWLCGSLGVAVLIAWAAARKTASVTRALTGRDGKMTADEVATCPA